MASWGYGLRREISSQALRRVAPSGKYHWRAALDAQGVR